MIDLDLSRRLPTLFWKNFFAPKLGRGKRGRYYIGRELVNPTLGVPHLLTLVGKVRMFFYLVERLLCAKSRHDIVVSKILFSSEKTKKLNPSCLGFFEPL